MRKRLIPAFAAVMLLLSGCSLFDGQYVRVVPHKTQSGQMEMETVSAENYLQLRDALCAMASEGRENLVIYVSDYDTDTLSRTMTSATKYLCETDPIGAYAVEDVTYEVGSNTGMTAVAVSLSYRKTPMEIQKIARVDDMEGAENAVLTALTECSPKAVLYIERYSSIDLTQLVQDLAQANPRTVMETPSVTEGIYGRGTGRVVELSFSYENSRDSLRQMQSQVRPVFDSAALYVSGEGEEGQKLSQLYAFLMERFDYTVETSITPAYSLLRHGVGDSRAFATVYAAMCRDAGLECRVVTGTRNGEPWTWNIVCADGQYAHVDLLRCSQEGGYAVQLDGDMTGYVWDYSAFPACVEKEKSTEDNFSENLEK